MFTFCSLQGAQSESSASQSLLELDGGIKVLIDVGWDESFDVEKLKELEKYVLSPSIAACLGFVNCMAQMCPKSVKDHEILKMFTA